MSLLMGFLLALPFATPRAAELTARLTENKSVIATGFTGVHTIAFGAIGEGDLIIVVRGPDRVATVREKRDVAGLWLNRRSIRFDRVPAYYAVFATRPLDDLLSSPKRAEAEIGLANLKLQPQPDASAPVAAEFRNALIRNYSAAALYADTIKPIELHDDRLFAVAIDLPASVPIGTYSVDVFLVRHGAVFAHTDLPLDIVAAGMSAEIRRASSEWPLYYGLLTVAAATAIGWLASIVLRSGR